MTPAIEAARAAGIAFTVHDDAALEHETILVSAGRSRRGRRV
jgi:hypothetical protein